MKDNQSSQKKLYIIPAILCIKLDNQISLALESVPPVPPGEELSKSSEYFSSSPFC